MTETKKLLTEEASPRKMKADHRKFKRKTDATYCLFTNCEDCPQPCIIRNMKKVEV